MAQTPLEAMESGALRDIPTGLYCRLCFFSGRKERKRGEEAGQLRLTHVKRDSDARLELLWNIWSDHDKYHA